MEHSTHQVSSRLSLEQVIAGTVGELERLQYSRRSLGRYRVVWRHLIVFGHEMSLGDEYSQRSWRNSFAPRIRCVRVNA